MPRIVIELPGAVLERARRHLLSSDDLCEEAAFLFSRAEQGSDALHLRVIDWWAVPREGFASRSGYYLELSDDARAGVIKRAHDLGAGLIEAHSHPGQRRACFSWSDLHGFDEFVPHVMWRLPDRPYAAVVFAPDSFDALAWRGPGAGAEAVAGLVTETCGNLPTAITLTNWSDIRERRSV